MESRRSPSKAETSVLISAKSRGQEGSWSSTLMARMPFLSICSVRLGQQPVQDLDHLLLGLFERAAIVELHHVVFAAHRQRSAGKPGHDILMSLAAARLQPAGEHFGAGGDVDDFQTREGGLEAMKR